VRAGFRGAIAGRGDPDERALALEDGAFAPSVAGDDHAAVAVEEPEAVVCGKAASVSTIQLH